VKKTSKKGEKKKKRRVNYPVDWTASREWNDRARMTILLEEGGNGKRAYTQN